MSRALRVLVALVFGLSALAACGDDGDGAAGDDGADDTAELTGQTGDQTGAQTGNATSEFAEYSAASQAINENETGPTPDLIDAAVDAAPADIAEEAATLGAKFNASGGDFGILMADGDFRTAFNAIEVWESAHCGDGSEQPELIEAIGDTAPADGATVVEVSALDFAFTVEERLAAGPVAFEVTNDGQNGHEAFVGKLADGTTLEEVLAFEGDPFEAGMVTDQVGFVLVPDPGETRYLNADLDAGTYAVVCFIPGPEGTPHAMLGMAREFSVS